MAAGLYKGWSKCGCMWRVGYGMELGLVSGGDCMLVCEVLGCAGWRRGRWEMDQWPVLPGPPCFCMELWGIPEFSV